MLDLAQFVLIIDQKGVTVNTKTTFPPQNEFDPDLSPKHQVNAEAAATQGLRFDTKKQSYVDEDGSLVLDKFGQPY